MKAWIVLEFVSLIGVLFCIVVGCNVEAATLMAAAVYCNVNARGAP